MSAGATTPALESLRCFAACVLALAPSFARSTYALACVRPLPRPRLGRRGLERTSALHDVAGFAAVEPVLRYAGAIVARLPLARARAGAEQSLLEAGGFHGLAADELFALAVWSALVAGAAGGLLAGLLQASSALPWLLAAVGGYLPFERMRKRRAERVRRITRQLPPTIDLLALCMNAGLDFTGALELLVRELHDERDPLAIECKQLLNELALGHTRKQALTALSARVPAEAVRAFAAAVIQAEQAGNPLREVLTIQARMLRMRRSVAAEEAAARASVLLVLPMMLLLSAIVLVMIGPFIVNGLGLS